MRVKMLPLAASIVLGVAVGLATGLAVSWVSTGSASPFIHTLADVLSSRGRLESVVRIMGPIAASAIGLSLAYRSGFITIGSEGQVLLGSLSTLGLLAYTGIGDSSLALPLSLALAALVGTAWGLIPGVLRAYLRVNEILSSLMLNYVALSIVNYMVSGPWRAGAFTATRSIPGGLGVSTLTVVALLIALAALYEALLRYTSLGIALEARGAAPKAAYTYAISPARAIIYASILSGLTAGIGGWLLMVGFQRSFTALSQPPGYGYMGVLVAWLSMRVPSATLAGSLLFSILIVAGFSMQTSGIPFNTVLLIQSLIVLSTLSSIALGVRGRGRG